MLFNLSVPHYSYLQNRMKITVVLSQRAVVRSEQVYIYITFQIVSDQLISALMIFTIIH